MAARRRYSIRQGSVALSVFEWGVAIVASVVSVIGLVLFLNGATAGTLLMPVGGLTLGVLAIVGSSR